MVRRRVYLAPTISGVLPRAYIQLIYLLALIDHKLYNTLHSLEFRAHILTRPYRSNCIGEGSWLVGICKESILDCILSFSFSILLKLFVGRQARCHYVCLPVSKCGKGIHTV